MASGLRILVPVKRVIDYAVSIVCPPHCAACGRPGIGDLQERDWNKSICILNCEKTFSVQC